MENISILNVLFVVNNIDFAAEEAARHIHCQLIADLIL